MARKSEAQPTRGPYKFWDREQPEHCMLTGESGRAGIARLISRIHGQDESLDEMRANGELIAIALNSHGDLLDACEQALDQLEWYAKDHAGDDQYEARIEVLRAAIAKATGKA
jgi:hypothetical protein